MRNSEFVEVEKGELDISPDANVSFKADNYRVKRQ